MNDTICAGCLENKKTLWCGGCRIIKYCSKTCQINDWKYHKEQCKILSKTRQIIKEDYQVAFFLKEYIKLRRFLKN
jgi:SET and MYND domain-containing protein